MKILIVTPAAPGSRSGNRHTARRWAGFMRQLGHRVVIRSEWTGESVDLLVALHARKSHVAIRAWRQHFPGRPIILALTGTDLYRDIEISAEARESMALADRMIVLQEDGLQRLSGDLQQKARVIYQSAPLVASHAPAGSHFEVCVIGHLREEKDPFCCYRALRRLSDVPDIRVNHWGRALTEEIAQEAKACMAADPRYRWRGDRPHAEVLRALAGSALMVISSRMEGGATVVSEALAAGVPMLASAISGNIGMLGHDYAGYFPVEDDAALARLLMDARNNPAFYQRLQQQCLQRRPLIDEERERAALEALLAELYPAYVDP